MSQSAQTRQRWYGPWLHSDLIGFPVTLAAVVIAAISFSLFLLFGQVGGLFIGKLLFVLGLGALLAFILRLEGRPRETTVGIPSVQAGTGPQRVLVVANRGLETSALCESVCERNGDGTRTLIVAPVAATTRLRAIADDIDEELDRAQKRVDVAIEVLRRAGVHAAGHVDVGSPMTCLVDGLREFSATEVFMIEGGEAGWKDAEQFADRVRRETGLPVHDIA